jgi:signal transduction histidine kinase
VQSLARMAEPGTRMKERLDRAVVSGERLDLLLGQVLDVSRITAGRLQLEPAEVRIDELVREVVERFADSAIAAHSPIEMRLAAVTSRCDRIRIEQVITNLLSNAIKYGNGKPIEIETSVEDRCAVVRVLDHGIGIAAEDRERIFERFERAQRTRSFGGLGLGLWISRTIVDASGGKIQATSPAGEGSTFTVWLPLAGQEEQ